MFSTKKILIALSLLTAATLSQAQVIQTNFEIGSYSPGVFGGKWSALEPRKVTLVEKNDHQVFYISPDSLVLFDRRALAMSNPLPNEGYEINLSTD